MVTRTTGTLAGLVLASLSVQAVPMSAPVQSPSPLVIAHRGASGYRPEHTLEAYTLAIEMGAGAIEPDLVSTKDGVLIARHENEIGSTTNVAERFPDRRTAKVIDGKRIEGWFTEDLTLAEIKTLRANERLEFRSHAYDGQYQIPTFDDVLELAASKSRALGRTISVYPETKHPSYFRAIGLPLEETLVRSLARWQLRGKAAAVFLQSFEADSLQRLRALTDVRLVFLTSRVEDATPGRLREIARFADGIGAEKRLVIPVSEDRLQKFPPTSLVKDAHAAGLFVHVWTLRADAQFLPVAYAGDMTAEAREFVALGVDGFFTDFPDLGVAGATLAR